ncbi:sulfate adenylyltransferase subunit CysD, partial [Alphaproteobacteria bacterium]|nr:sulfate adenylyltransferase subunit CysD [Alphaproteobacteria bacterium]
KGIKYLFANDRRNGRLWVKIKSYKEIDIIEGLRYFSKIRKKNIIILPHLDLLDNFKKSEELNSKSKLSIHLPQYIFQTSKINIKETIFKKKFTLKKNSYLSDLEAESIHIIREVVSETKNPVMLYSVGKDSSVMLHLAKKAFYPSPPPFPLMHVDTRWKFQEMYLFRDWMVKKSNMKLISHINPDGIKGNVNPFDHGSSAHTDIMKTQGLKQALDQYEFDAAFGGARRDEEKSRAKERIFSFRTSSHQWDPKNQRPELWNLYNAKVNKSESIRVFPLSNWTELDIWQYIYQEQIPIVPLYFAKYRPVIQRDGMLLMVDDDRLNIQPKEKIELKKIRFRTLGCYPLTGAIESDADTLESIVLELLQSKTSERQGRAIDADSSNSMEKKKLEGYF